MNPYQFLKQLNGIPTGAPPGGGGDGFRREIEINLMSDMRTAAFTTMTGATVPAIVQSADFMPVIQCVNNQTAAGTFALSVPKDYDPVKDELTVRVIANGTGNTDQITLQANMTRKRAGSAAVGPVNSNTVNVPKSASPNTAAVEVTLTFSGNGLKPDDSLLINLVTNTHTTDSLNIYDVDVVYRSNLVFTDSSAR